MKNNNLKKNYKKIVILVVPLLLCAILYPFLPDEIPRQFHFDGTKSYMAKEYIFLLGLIPYIIYISRKRK